MLTDGTMIRMAMNHTWGVDRVCPPVNRAWRVLLCVRNRACLSFPTVGTYCI